MFSKCCGLLLAVSLLGGCVHTVMLSPVVGPLSSAVPRPVYVARLSGLIPPYFTVTIANGEVCKGKSTSEDHKTPSDRSLPDVWDEVYGKGFYTTHVLGRDTFEAALLGDKGTKLNLVLLIEKMNAGVAQDSNGNVYKILVSRPSFSG